jgi:hypothetical protein
VKIRRMKRGPESGENVGEQGEDEDQTADSGERE